MRRSRLKTLAAVVSGALEMKGVGVLALGRAMAGKVAAKHCIKRVWRFLRNPGLETEALSAALFRFLRPPTGHTYVLVDWTDIHPFQQWVFSLPRDGRALPFLCLTIRKGTGEDEDEGAMVEAEQRGLEMLARMCPPEVKPIVVADRGFGHPRWLKDVQKRGWHFVQRLSHIHQVCVEQHMGTLKELGIRRGRRPRDWGLGFDAVRLSAPERHFCILAVAYVILCAFGAAAETFEIARLFKANTRAERVRNLARLGNYFLRLARCSLETASGALAALPT